MLKSDVLVVGAGLSGVLAARSLARRGLSVLVLDAGRRLKRPPSTTAAFERAARSFVAIDDARWGYDNAGTRYRWLRVRAVGGRSLSWGGWLDAPDRAYFDARRDAGYRWPFDLDALSPYIARARRELHAKTSRVPAPFHALAQKGLRLQPKVEAVVPRGRRALTALDLAAGVRVVEQAVALRVLSAADGTARGVEAIVDGKPARFAASSVVLAASPIETARIVHHTPRAASDGLGASLHDHLVAGAIAIAPADVAAIADRRRGEPDSGAVVFPSRGDDVRMTLELRAPKPLTSLDDEDLETLGFDRKSARGQALFAVFALAETDPAARRRVSFDDLRADALGRARPVLEISSLTSRERDICRALKARVRESARLIGGKDATVYLVRDPRELGDVGHECGTVPMGKPGASVVDFNGAVHGMRGVFVADASPLPGALDRHPSLTLAAYALRTADAVVRERRERRRG